MLVTRARSGGRGAGLAALAIATLLLASGCQTDPNAAAVVGGSAITLATLEHTVDLALADPNFATSVGGRPAAERAELARLVAQRLIADLAARDGVHASLLQVEQEQSAISSAIQSQQGMSLDAYYAAIGIPPAQVTSIIRSITLEGLLGNRLAHLPPGQAGAATPQQQAAAQNSFRSALLAESRRLRVAINPRFGTWSAAQLQVLAAPNVLSVPAR